MDYKEALQDPIVRVKAMEDNFPLFFVYHYWRPLKDFQLDWADSMASRNNTMIVAFRASRKTTMARAFIVWCICYKKEPSIVWQSYEDSLSGESVREIAKMLCVKSIVDDYWMLFPFQSKKEDLTKRSLQNFETTNGVKVASKSLGQTLRWANTFDMEEWQSARPTLLVLDDIDVIKSVNNVEIINQNEKKILWETISALDPLKRKIIFLGNIINEDWIVPRFWNLYKDSDRWDCFSQPLFSDKWVNARPEVFTDDVVAEIESDGKTSFNQNYLLIPSQSGNGVFIKDYFDYFLKSHFEEEDSFLKKQDVRRGIFIDPAFSTSKKSDDACVLWVWEHKISKWYYLLEWYADTSAPSKTREAIVVMYNNMVAEWYAPEFISVESATISTKQTQFIADLKETLIKHQINVPIYIYEPKIKKEDRIKYNLESIMSQKGIKFSRNISDPNFMFKMERQFLEFPNGDHDDIIDTLSQAIEVFRKKPEKQEAKPLPMPVSAITRRQIQNQNPRKWWPTTRMWSFSGITGKPL